MLDLFRALTGLTTVPRMLFPRSLLALRDHVMEALQGRGEVGGELGGEFLGLVMAGGWGL